MQCFNWFGIFCSWLFYNFFTLKVYWSWIVISIISILQNFQYSCVWCTDTSHEYRQHNNITTCHHGYISGKFRWTMIMTHYSIFSAHTLCDNATAIMLLANNIHLQQTKIITMLKGAVCQYCLCQWSCLVYYIKKTNHKLSDDICVISNNMW